MGTILTVKLGSYAQTSAPGLTGGYNKISAVVVEEDGVEIYDAKPNADSDNSLRITHILSAGSSSTGGSGSLTIASTPMSDAVVGVGGTRSFSVASHFTPSDSSAVLSYHAYVDNHALLAVESMDNAAGTFDLRSLGTAIGSATVIVKAVASVSGSAVAVKTEKFTLTVTADENDPVRTTEAWPDVTGARNLSLSEYFSDADGFDQLVFTAASSDTSVVTASIVQGPDAYEYVVKFKEDDTTTSTLVNLAEIHAISPEGVDLDWSHATLTDLAAAGKIEADGTSSAGDPVSNYCDDGETICAAWIKHAMDDDKLTQPPAFAIFGNLIEKNETIMRVRFPTPVARWEFVYATETTQGKVYVEDKAGVAQSVKRCVTSTCEFDYVPATVPPQTSVGGPQLVLENAMTTSGTSTATVTVTASDPNASVDSELTVTFSFSLVPEVEESISLTKSAGWQNSWALSAIRLHYIPTVGTEPEYTYYVGWSDGNWGAVAAMKYDYSTKTWSDSGTGMQDHVARDGADPSKIRASKTGHGEIFSFVDPYH